MSARFEVKQAKNGKHYFNLLAANGEVILTSQMYSSAASAKKGIASVQTNAGDDTRYERREGKGGKTHFVLKAANHRVIGSSETYSTAAKMEKGIKAVMKCNGVRKIVQG